MSPRSTARPAPLSWLIGLALVAGFVFALVKFHLGERFIFAWLLLAIVVAGAPLALTLGTAWALNRRHLKLARWLSFDKWTRGWLEIQIAIMEGDLAVAQRLFDQLPRTTLGDVYGWNLFVNALITQGRYRDAVRIRARFAGRLHEARAQLREHYGLALLNIAEALYNLGRWRRARQLMERLDSGGYLKDPLNRAAGQAQLAWIDAHEGQVKNALDRLAAIDASAFPYDYRAELHFTVAAAHLANRDVAKAREALEVARRHVVRPSSARNLLFLEARCDHAEGKLREAAAKCERAANERYQGQGGDGLLLWGDVCEQLGDAAGAENAWRLAIARDPESESAALARGRLAHPRQKSA